MPFLLIVLFVVAMVSPGRAETPANRQFAIIFNNTKTDGGFNELALRGLPQDQFAKTDDVAGVFGNRDEPVGPTSGVSITTSSRMTAKSLSSRRMA